MIRRAIPYVALWLLAAGLSLPALAEASPGRGSSSGGAGFGGGSAADDTASVAQPGNVTVTATGGGVTITTLASGMLRQGLAVSGSVPASDAGQTVDIQLWGSKTNWTWQTIATAQVQSGGAFSAVWQTNHIGRFEIRATVGSGGGATTSAGAPTVTVVVYRPSVATLYGPGFYGHRTACGVVLRRNTIGLANRTLPCGTSVALYYDGRTLTVPVIDRGPYAHGADWDLTMATGKALGMGGTATLGATSLPRIS